MATFDIEVVGLDERTGRATFVATGTDGGISRTVRCAGQIDPADVAESVKALVAPVLRRAYAEATAVPAASPIEAAIKAALKAELEKAQVEAVR